MTTKISPLMGGAGKMPVGTVVSIDPQGDSATLKKTMQSQAMKAIKPKGRYAKRMSFYTRLRVYRGSLGKMIVGDIRKHIIPLFSAPSN